MAKGKCSLLENITAGILKSLILVLLPGFLLWKFSSIVSGPEIISISRALTYATGITVLFAVIAVIECRLPLPFAVIARLSDYVITMIIAYWWGGRTYTVNLIQPGVTATVSFEKLALVYMVYTVAVGVIDVALMPIERIRNE